MALSEAFADEGAVSVDITDAREGMPDETPVFGEPGGEVELAFGLNRMVVLFAPGTDIDRAVAAAVAACGLAGTPAFKVSDIPERDWVRATQGQFSPIRISQRLWIVPSWHELPDPTAINIVLDPGLAFGTGSHPTTRLCLGWLDRSMRPGRSVIDYGCGSGILAIAAAKLGAARVCGIDIDDQAVESSRYNARNNGVSIGFSNAAEPAPAPADIVLANILSNPLKVLAPLLADLTRPGGTAVLSGILAAQAGDVAAVYEEWFDIQLPAYDEGWTCLVGMRRS
ncbi:MAG TPA: 50S ribosomal protein L11 methyltransferase [Burkholderiales bacterium]|nr:50S ribosomal protein L11 methyltransferase [Burkholderiales bacterium]